MLNLLESGKTILNIDETWIGEGDFRFKKWTKRGLKNTLATKDVTPRISMISAIGINLIWFIRLIKTHTSVKEKNEQLLSQHSV